MSTESLKPTISQLKEELSQLTDFWRICQSPEVQEAIKAVRQKNAPRVAELQAQIKALRNAKPGPKPRWPENTPKPVLEACERFWSGIEEFRTFRIHLWNDKAVWTSYPSGGYSTVGGRQLTPPSYHLISLTQTEFKYGTQRPAELVELRFEHGSGQARHSQDDAGRTGQAQVVLMNTRLKPPCLVSIEGSEEALLLRKVSRPSQMLKRNGWVGLVAVVQNKKGSGLVEYQKLRRAERK